jgi:hypothetical protein
MITLTTQNAFAVEDSVLLLFRPCSLSARNMHSFVPAAFKLATNLGVGRGLLLMYVKVLSSKARSGQHGWDKAGR